MNRTIASLSIGTALTLTVASGFFFTSLSPSVGQLNTGAVASVLTEQLGTLEQGEKSTNTSNDPIADFLADESWTTVLKTYSGADCPNARNCQISDTAISRILWDQCTAAGACNVPKHISENNVLWGISPGDIVAFISFLNGIDTSHIYFLPTATQLKSLVAVPTGISATCKIMSSDDLEYGQTALDDVLTTVVTDCDGVTKCISGARCPYYVSFDVQGTPFLVRKDNPYNRLSFYLMRQNRKD